MSEAVARFLRAAPPFRGKARIGEVIGRPSGRLVQVRMRDGSLMTIDLLCATERDVYWTGEYERGAIRELARMLGPDSVVVDVGANIGFYTVGLAHTTGARVYAFEPMPANAERLRENVDANGLSERVTVAPIALGDTSGHLWLAPEVGAASTGNAAQTDAGADGAVRVDVRPLDDIAGELAIERCDLVKIDVEGAELAVLRGGEAFFRRCRPAIHLELNRHWMDRRGWSEADLIALANDWGYALTRTRVRVSSMFENVLLVPR